MALVGSMKAQKLAEDLLGLDMQTTLPEHAAYRGKYVEGVTDFYGRNKKAIMIIGGLVLVSGAAWYGYKMYQKREEAKAE